MRIVVATVRVPFVFGGAEIHAEELRRALTAEGHAVEVIAVPFKWYPPERILDHMLACRLLDLTEAEGRAIDVLIGLKFPAYLVTHPNKVIWLLHQHRQAYDMWDAASGGDLVYSECGPAVRDAIINADKKVIPEARAIFANSHNVAKRLQRFCGIGAKPLYHPPPAASEFYSCPAEPYLFFPSRLVASKRQDLVLSALAKTRCPVRVKFVGVPNHPDYLVQLQKTAAKLRIEDRVEWLGGVSEEEKRELYARCLGVVYPPSDEDYGYVTLEAMLSAKPLIVTNDSGGPLEFIEDGINGLVAEPTAEGLAGTMDRMWNDRQGAVRWGKAGLEKYRAANISWPHVVQSLLNAVRP
jgi:glycosyltransferase involved in cell wall biosynthesis